MKKIVMLSVLLLVATGSKAMKVLIEKPILENRLEQNGFDSFAKKTDLINKLTQRNKITSLRVAFIIECAILSCEEKLKTETEKRKSELIKLILKDYPAAFNILCKGGIIC